MAVPRVKVISKITGCFAALLLMCSCVPREVLPEHQVTSLLFVAPGKTLIVGRIELHPPLQPGEQLLNEEQGAEHENEFILFCGDQLRDLREGKPDTYAGSFSTTFEKEFFVKIDRVKTLFISGGMFFTEYDPPSRRVSPVFSSPFQVTLKPNDEAVYIGTIQYYRDEHNAVRTVMVRDDYAWADSRYKERFGTSKSLRKALVTPAALPPVPKPDLDKPEKR
jgi:hypothetical protein